MSERLPGSNEWFKTHHKPNMAPSKPDARQRSARKFVVCNTHAVYTDTCTREEHEQTTGCLLPQTKHLSRGNSTTTVTLHEADAMFACVSIQLTDARNEGVFNSLASWRLLQKTQNEMRQGAAFSPSLFSREASAPASIRRLASFFSPSSVARCNGVFPVLSPVLG